MKKVFIALLISSGAAIVILIFFDIANAFALEGAGDHVQRIPKVYALMAATLACLGWVTAKGAWSRLAILLAIAIVAMAPIKMSWELYPKNDGDISLLDWITIANSLTGAALGIANYYVIKYLFAKDAKNCSAVMG